MLTISVWPRRLKEFLLTHPLYKSPACRRTLPNGPPPPSTLSVQLSVSRPAGGGTILAPRASRPSGRPSRPLRREKNAPSEARVARGEAEPRSGRKRPRRATRRPPQAQQTPYRG